MFFTPERCRLTRVLISQQNCAFNWNRSCLGLAQLLLQVSWSADVLAHAERPATSPSVAIGDPHFAGLSWLPGGDALAVLDSLGHLAICDIKIDSPTAAHADSFSSRIAQVHAPSQCADVCVEDSSQAAGTLYCACNEQGVLICERTKEAILKHGACMQADVQLSVGKMMGVPGWPEGDAAAVSTPQSLAMCAYRPADRSSFRLAILRGSELTVLAVDSRPNTAAVGQASALPAPLGAADAAAGEEYTDITPAIGALERPQPFIKQPKQKSTPRLSALAACVSPPLVKEDEER